MSNKTVGEMTKDELAEHALAEHGVELDMTKKLKALRAQVAALDGAGEGDEEAPAPVAEKRPTHYRCARNRVYVATPQLDKLAKAGKLTACDKDWKPK